MSHDEDKTKLVIVARSSVPFFLQQGNGPRVGKTLGPRDTARNGSRFVTSRVLDRKSTRLNSSHQIISYAVFCLKKKKRTDEFAIQSTRHFIYMRLEQA